MPTILKNVILNFNYTVSVLVSISYEYVLLITIYHLLDTRKLGLSDFPPIACSQNVMWSTF